MKHIIAAIAATAAFLATDAEVLADYSEGEQSAVLITPELEGAASAMLGPTNAAALLHAIRLQMSLYDGDMRSQDGRRRWHGKLVHEEIYTNELVKVEVYSNAVDGAVWRYRTHFKPKVSDPTAYNKRLPQPPMTNGIPVALAKARMQTYENRNTESNVTVKVTVGGTN